MVELSDLSQLRLEFEDVSDTGDGNLRIVCVVSVERALQEDMPVTLRSKDNERKTVVLRAGQQSVTADYIVSVGTPSVTAQYGKKPGAYPRTRGLRATASLRGWQARKEPAAGAADEVPDTSPSPHGSSSDTSDQDTQGVPQRSEEVAKRSTLQECGFQQIQQDLLDTLHTISEGVARVEELQRTSSSVSSQESLQPQKLLVRPTEVQPGEYVLVATIHPPDEGQPVLCTIVHKSGIRESHEYATDNHGSTGPIAVSVAKQERHVHVVLEVLDIPAYTIRLFNLQETFESY